MRLKARLLEEVDLPLRVAWFNDPRIYRNMPIEVPVSLANTRQWFTDNRMNPRRWDFAFVNCCSGQPGDSETVVAMGGLTSILQKDRRAELYILVGPEHQGKGVGTQCTIWLANFGFGTLGLHRVYLYTLEENQKAKQMYERLGFVLEGLLRQHTFHLGDWADRNVMGLLRADWERTWWKNEELVLEWEFHYG